MNSRGRFRLNAKRRTPIPAHSLSCGERSKPPVSRSRSTEVKGAEGGNRTKYFPLPHSPPSVSLNYFLANLCWHPHPKQNTQEKEKKKTALGSSTSCPPGGALWDCLPKGLHRQAPNTSTFCLSYVVLVFSVFFSSTSSPKWNDA